MASFDHLHQETKILPVVDHTDLLCAQFLASASRRSHPSNSVINLPHGPRDMKPTLSSKFGPTVRPFLHNGALPQLLYNPTKNRLHTYAVRNSIRNFKRNRVLRARPPLIHHSESTLP